MNKFDFGRWFAGRWYYPEVDGFFLQPPGNTPLYFYMSGDGFMSYWRVG